MKTVKELEREFYLCESVNDFIKQIQLDAMKEGMKRAAFKIDSSLRPSVSRQTILTAAEELTEKDL